MSRDGVVCPTHNDHELMWTDMDNDILGCMKNDCGFKCKVLEKGN